MGKRDLLYFHINKMCGLLTEYNSVGTWSSWSLKEIFLGAQSLELWAHRMVSGVPHCLLSSSFSEGQTGISWGGKELFAFLSFFTGLGVRCVNPSLLQNTLVRLGCSRSQRRGLRWGLERFSNNIQPGIYWTWPPGTMYFPLHYT